MPIPRARVRINPLRLHPTRVLTRGIPDLPGIYRIVCLPLRMAYVGQAYSLVKRAMEHQVELRDGTHMNQRLLGAYHEYGAAQFAFQVLEIYHGRYSPDCLSPAEQRWMDAHGKPSLFNIRRAGSDDWLAATDNASSTNKSRFSRPQGRVQGIGTQSAKDWRNGFNHRKPK